MYVDIILLILIIVAVIFFFKRFSSFIYLICSLDILYRLLHFISNNLGVPELSTLIDKYIPTSIPGIAENYVGADSIIYTVVLWIMFIIYSILLFYMIRILAKRK